MSESIFGDKTRQPDIAELEKALGKSTIFLNKIETHLIDQFGEIEREWKFYNKKAGWTFALMNNGKRLLHVIPRSGFFSVVITLGKKAVSASQHIILPPKIISEIENAKEYAEGKSIRIDVSSEKNITIVIKLVVIKMF